MCGAYCLSRFKIIVTNGPHNSLDPTIKLLKITLQQKLLMESIAAIGYIYYLLFTMECLLRTTAGRRINVTIRLLVNGIIRLINN